MVGVAYAAVPLYQLFCQVTGYGGTTQRVEQYSDQRARPRRSPCASTPTCRAACPGISRRSQRDVTMKIGETVAERITAPTNLFDTPTAGRATFNVTPEIAGAYFNKVECFCFTDTTLKPGETLDMPVVFYVDPGDRRRARAQGHQDDHAFLHLLPHRSRQAGCRGDAVTGDTKLQTNSGADMADAHAKPQHDYHLVDPSPWPFIGSVGALVMAIGGVACMQYLKAGDFPFFGVNIANPWLFFIGLLIVLYTMFAWWSDTIKEAHEGYHTRVVSLHLRYGMIMFIASEVMFFVAWFWAFFDASLFPDEVAAIARDRVHRRRLAAEGHRGARSLPPAALQHDHPAAVRHDGDLGAPCAAPQRPQGPGLGPRR